MARPPGTNVGPEPEASPIEAQGLGWKNAHGCGRAADTITSGLEGAWTSEPTKWDNGFLENLYAHDWELTVSPAGAKQWRPKNGAGAGTVPDAHDASKRHAPMMFTTDLAIREDPAYDAISKRFRDNPGQLATAFAKAWYKLLHRDMGPVSRYLGPWVPEPQLWQDPVPPLDHEPIDNADVAVLEGRLLQSGLSIAELVSTAWASASSFRGTDMRGGANGARSRLAPQKDWEVNEPARLEKVLRTLEGIQQDFDRSQTGNKRISLADLIVLGGCVGVEQAARAAGHDISVPFTPGRTDASQEQTDVESFAVLEPEADGFRNYLRAGQLLSPETLLLERAYMLRLTAPQMTVLVGGLRALGIHFGQTCHGVFTTRPGTLTNDFFKNLLDASTEWKKSGSGYEGRDRSGPVDRHRRRPGLRGPLAAPRPRGGLRGRRREGEVRARLRGCVVQGHEPRSVRGSGPERATVVDLGLIRAGRGGRRRPDRRPRHPGSGRFDVLHAHRVTRARPCGVVPAVLGGGRSPQWESSGPALRFVKGSGGSRHILGTGSTASNRRRKGMWVAASNEPRAAIGEPRQRERLVIFRRGSGRGATMRRRSLLPSRGPRQVHLDRLARLAPARRALAWLWVALSLSATGCIRIYQPMSGLHRPVVVDPQLANFQDLNLVVRCIPEDLLTIQDASVLCRKVGTLFENQGARVTTSATASGAPEDDGEPTAEGTRAAGAPGSAAATDLTLELRARRVHSDNSMVSWAICIASFTLVPAVSESTFAQDVVIRDGNGFLLVSDSLEGRLVQRFGAGTWIGNKFLDLVTRDRADELAGDAASRDLSSDLYRQLSQMVFNAEMQRQILEQAPRGALNREAM